MGPHRAGGWLGERHTWWTGRWTVACGAYRVGGQTLKGHFTSPNAFSSPIAHGGSEPWALWGSGDEVNFLLL